MLIFISTFFDLIGGWDGSRPFNTIFEYNPDADEWSEIGAMKEARATPGVSLVSYREYADWCN